MYKHGQRPVQAKSKVEATVKADAATRTAEIYAQIAALQAKAAALEQQEARSQAGNANGSNILVKGSPSPSASLIVYARPASHNSRAHISITEKRKALDGINPGQAKRARSLPGGGPRSQHLLLTAKREEPPSRFATHLQAQRSSLRAADARREAPKTSGFSHAARLPKSACVAADESDGEEEGFKPSVFQDRDDNLALVESIEPGPLDFRAKADDPLFERIEPYSKIRLKSRALPHERFQDHMAARYYVSPSMLYSIVRPGRGTELEVPVDGDWIIIGVLAEKSDIKVTAGSAPKGNERKLSAKKPKKKKQADDDAIPKDATHDNELLDSDDDTLHDNDEAEDESNGAKRFQPRQKRYMFFKLLDMRPRRGAAVAAGDSFVSIALFESDSSTVMYEAESSDEETAESGARFRKEASQTKQRKKETYKGGSGGAYEKFWKEKEGTVVAIMNPKVMKPRHNPHQPASNTLTLTPESADSIVIIGQSLDLLRCSAQRKDGIICGAACDARINEICDFHVQAAVQRARSGRSELMTGTSGLVQNLNNGAKKKKQFSGGIAQAPYDPVRKIGLLPDSNKRQIDGIVTYVSNGGSGSRPGRRLTGEPTRALPTSSANATRDKESLQEKKRKREDADLMLRKVLKRDKGTSVGMQYLHYSKPDVAKSLYSDDEEEPSETPGSRQKRAFDAVKIKALGFDPSKRDRKGGDDDDGMTQSRRMECFAALDSGKDRVEPKLGPAPHKRMSGVAPPSDEEEDEGLVIVKPKVKRVKVNPNPRSQYNSNDRSAFSAQKVKLSNHTQVSEPKAQFTSASGFKSNVHAEDGGDSMLALMANFRKAAAARP